MSHHTWERMERKGRGEGGQELTCQIQRKYLQIYQRTVISHGTKSRLLEVDGNLTENKKS